MFEVSRDPGSCIKKILRSEVNFGCPVEGCGCPILTYHHFDPPWAGNFRHNPSGMIALCQEHHDQADGGLWSKQQLREMKRHPYVCDPTRVRWPYSPETLVLKIGPSLIVGSGTALRLNGNPVLHFQPATIDQLGIKNVEFNSNIVSSSGAAWLKIDRNWLEVEKSAVTDFYFKPSVREFCARHKDNSFVKLRYQNIYADKLEDWLKKIIVPDAQARQAGKLKPQLVKEFADEIVSRKAINNDGIVPVMEITGRFEIPEVRIHVTRSSFTAHFSSVLMGRAETVKFESRLLNSVDYMSLRYDPSRFGGREFLGVG